MLGIALVVEDVTKGPKLAFRYPGPVPIHRRPRQGSKSYDENAEGVAHSDAGAQQVKTDEGRGSSVSGTADSSVSPATKEGKLRKLSSNEIETNEVSGDTKGSNPNSVLDALSSNSNLPTKTSSGQTENRASGPRTKHMWRFEASLFAKLFRPSSALCGKSFELVIDKVRFVSHPVLIPRSNENSDEHHDGEISMFNVVFVLDAELDRVMEDSRRRLGLPPTSTAYGNTFPGSGTSIKMYKDAAAKLGAALLHEEKRSGYVSSQVQLMLQVLEHRDALGENKSHSTSASQSTSNPNSSTSASIASATKQATNNSGVETGDRHGSENDGKDSTKIKKKLSEEVHGTSEGAFAGPKKLDGASETKPGDDAKNSSKEDGKLEDNQNHGPSMGGNKTDHRSKSSEASKYRLTHRAIKQILQKSELARELMSIFHSLNETGTVEISFQSWVRVSLSLQHPGLHPQLSLRPYQTLLLVENHDDDKSSVLQEFEPDASPVLYKFVEFVAKYGPLKSFQDISVGIDEPLADVYRMAAHLTYWRKGRIIDALSKQNIYRISPSISLKQDSPIYGAFEALLDGILDKSDKRRKLIKLPSLLAMFSMASKAGLPRILADHMETAATVLNLTATEFIEVLIWCLQHELLVQLHQHIFFIPPLRSTRSTKLYRGGDVRGMPDSAMHRSISAQSLHRNASDQSTPPQMTGEDISDPNYRRVFHSHQYYMHRQQTPQQHQTRLPNDGAPSLNTPTNGATTNTIATNPSASSNSSTGTTSQANSSGVANANPSTPPGGNALSSNVTTNLQINRISYLERVATDSDHYRLLKRLSPYLNGNYSIEEIMWRESVSREDINALVQTYSEALVPTFF